MLGAEQIGCFVDVGNGLVHGIGLVGVSRLITVVGRYSKSPSSWDLQRGTPLLRFR